VLAAKRETTVDDAFETLREYARAQRPHPRCLPRRSEGRTSPLETELISACADVLSTYQEGVFTPSRIADSRTPRARHPASPLVVKTTPSDALPCRVPRIPHDAGLSTRRARPGWALSAVD
jgi:hypothetical protein